MRHAGTPSAMPGRRATTAARRDTVRHLLDVVFLVGVVVKGLDGLVELVAGIPLLFLTPASLTSFVRSIVAGELLEDPHGLLTDLLLRGLAQLHGHDAFLLGVYLLVHGIVKVAIVTALIIGAVRVYPWAIAALAALTVYQIVELALHPSVGLVLLTVLDIVIIALTWREWHERRSLRQTWAATAAWIRRREEDPTIRRG